MAASPPWKVYDRAGVYQASCKEAAAAAALSEWYGEGATVRLEHRRVVWSAVADRIEDNEEVERLMRERGGM